MTQVRKLIQSHQAEKPCNPWSADEKKATWNFQKMEINRKLSDESQMELKWWKVASTAGWPFKLQLRLLKWRKKLAIAENHSIGCSTKIMQSGRF